MDKFGVMLFWFVLTFVALLALGWMVGWTWMKSEYVPLRDYRKDSARREAAEWLQLPAALSGIAGAWLLATQFHPAWGFRAFLVSNVGWIAFSAAKRHRWLLVQQFFFLVSSLIGLWNWWLGPLLLRGAA